MKTILRMLAFSVLLVGAPCGADTFPSKPIRLVVPFTPGGPADGIGRLIGERIGAMLGTSVVVDNRPGGLTVIGADMVAKSPPDGYTLLVIPGTHVLTPLLVRSVPYDPLADFTPIALVGTQPYFVLTNASQPYQTLGDMISDAKRKPGQLAVGITDSVTQIIATALMTAAGIDLNLITYKSGAPAVADLLGNQIPLLIAGPYYMPYIKEGRLRALATTTPTRVDALPNTPAIAEVLPESKFDVQTWYGIAGPAKMPADIVARLRVAIAAALKEPDVRERLRSIGIAASIDADPAAMPAMMRSYQERMGALARAAGIKPQ